MNSLKSILIGLISVLAAHAECKTYFLFAAGPGYDSFVLPVSDEDQVLTVRQEMLKPMAERRSPAVLLAKGADGINRDLLAPGAPLWSWHVTEFLHFWTPAEVIGFDPTRMEASPDEFLKYQEGAQGRSFAFGYVPILELAPALCITTNFSDGVWRLTWPDFGDRFLYTVEHTANLDSPEWKPLPGPRWPSNVTHLTLTGQPAGFYRVIRIVNFPRQPEP